MRQGNVYYKDYFAGTKVDIVSAIHDVLPYVIC